MSIPPGGLVSLSGRWMGNVPGRAEVPCQNWLNCRTPQGNRTVIIWTIRTAIVPVSYAIPFSLPQRLRNASAAAPGTTSETARSAALGVPGINLRPRS